jgi:hypothetical protein
MKAPKIDGTATGELMVQDDAEQYDSPEILAKTAERLKAMGGNPEPVVVPDPQEADESNEDPTPTPVIKEDDAADDTDDNEGVVNTEGNDDGDLELVIPEKLLRAAEHNGWKKEKTAALWKLDEDAARQVLEKMHQDQVSVNTIFAEQGRVKKQLDADREALEQSRAVPVQSPEKPKGFVDVKAYKEEHGEAAGVVVEQLNNALVELSQRQEQIQVQTQTQQNQGTQETKVAKQEQGYALVQQLGQWFADPALVAYEKFYGSGKDANGFPLITVEHLTAEQKLNRGKLIDMAHDIDAGVRLRGGNMSIPEALRSAHVVLTADIQTEMVRKDIMDKAKKRAKGVTLRASGTKITPAVILKPGQKMTDKQFASVTEKRLANLRAGKPLDG